MHVGSYVLRTYGRAGHTSTRAGRATPHRTARRARMHERTLLRKYYVNVPAVGAPTVHVHVLHVHVHVHGITQLQGWGAEGEQAHTE